MINTGDDRAIGEEERGEPKTDFRGLRETAETIDHREQRGWAEVRGWEAAEQIK